MNLFIVSASLLTLAVVAWMVWPLLRSGRGAGVSPDALNANIHREQWLVLESDLARGAITPSDFEASRDELQLRLLDDVSTPQPASPASPHVRPVFWTAKRMAVMLGLSIPVFSVMTYLQSGTPAAIDPVMTAQANDHQMNQMIEALAAKLRANPDNPKGWAMLGRSYKVMGRWAEAEQAFLKTGDLLMHDPDLLTDYADLLAVKADNNIEGRPLELVSQALAINPKHPMGLMMSGVAAYRRQDYKLAVTQWERLLDTLEPGSPDAQQVESDLNNARAKAKMGESP